MTAEEIAKMWELDAKLQLGVDISIEDKKWFNDHFDSMRYTMQSNADHWRFYTEKIKLD